MKYLLFFTLVLMGVLTSSTQGCNPDGHSAAKRKSDNSHGIEYEDVTATITPSIAEQTNHGESHDETTMEAKPSSEAAYSTEEPTIVLAEIIDKTAPVVAENPAKFIDEGVDNTSVATPVEMTTVAAHVISAENPDEVATYMTAMTAPTLHTEPSYSMPMILPPSLIGVGRERRQANDTTNTSTPPNIPVFGGRFSPRAPMQGTRQERQGMTVGPKMVTQQPARLPPTEPSREPMKPQPITTGPVPERG